MAEKFGMMSQAYFKGKRELLGWISSFLQMDITKVELLASGAHYCQMLDALYPGCVKLSKVNFGAYLEETYVQNWKLVQIAFGKHGIQKIIPVQRLVKARFQDNLEFLQWFHQFFIQSYHGAQEYNPVERRKRCKGSNQRQGRRNKRARYSEEQTVIRSCKNKENQRPVSSFKSAHTERKKFGRFPNEISKTCTGEKLKRELNKLMEVKVTLKKKLDRISSTAKAIESERDFYFQVLLKVETMCKESENPENPDIIKIMDILYSSNDEGRDDMGGEKPLDHGECEILVENEPLVEDVESI